MKIAILYFQSTYCPITGDDTYLLNLSRSLVERGHEVKILNLFNASSGISLWGDRVKRTLYSGYIFANASKLRHYDLILFTEPLFPYSMVLLRYLKSRLNIPIVLYVGVPRITSKLYYSLIKGKFPALICGETASSFANYISYKVGLITPGVDTETLRPLETEKKWDLLYIGHLYREKGVLDLLQAMRWLKSKGYHLKLKIICTQCSEEKFYHRYIRENGLDNVDIESSIIKNLALVYNCAKVFVYPGISYNRVNEVPLTIIEAAACGLPVVTSLLYRHIKLPNITFTNTDPESLAVSILNASSKWDNIKRDQTLNLIHEKYSIASLGKSAESFFKEVING